MKTKTDILELIGRDRRYKGYCKRYATRVDPSEVYSEFLKIMCEKPDNVIVDAYNSGKLHNLCRTVIYNLINLEGSKFNYVSKLEPKFYQLNEKIDKPDYIATYTKIDEAIDIVLKNEAYWFNEKLWFTYVENDCNLAKTSRRTGIPIYTIRNWLNYMKQEFKKKYEELCNIS